MNLNDLLKDFGNHLGLTDLALDSNGVCGLDIGDDIHVNVERHPGDDNTLLLHTALRLAPTENPGRRQIQMLLANHHTERTHGCVFSLDATTQEVILWTSLHAEGCEIEDLSQALSNLVTCAREWTPKLDAAHHASSTEETIDYRFMIRA